MIQQKDHNKSSVKRKNSNDDNSDIIHQSSLFYPLNEIKYQLHLCYKELGQYGSAIKILQSIPKESVI